MKVQVKVNERGALRNGRFAFTDGYTLVTELMQNARRAGASEVIIEFDEEARRLVVTDDGSGIDNFQSLLNFNESAWDESTVLTERPFGLGFSKCLYSASKVHITSRGQSLAFDCDAALNQEELDVLDDTEAPQGLTVVTLDGVELPKLHSLIDRLSRGFPIPVRYNGALQPRSHSPGNLTFVETDVGLIYLSGEHNGKRPYSTAIYLQGLLVGDASRDYFNDHSGVDVVHLDSTKFMARMPDRRELIDSQEQMQKVNDSVRQLWAQILARQKAELLGPIFIERYFDVAGRYGLVNVFDDVPFIPRQACSVVVGYPNSSDDSNASMDIPSEHPSADAVASGKLKVAGFTLEYDESDFVTLMYAKAAGLTLVEPDKLGEGHWVHRDLRDLNDEEAAVTPSGVTSEFRFSGLYASSQVVLCDAIDIRHGIDVVQFSEEALLADGRILYPLGCSDGEVVKQIESYRDEFEKVDETACDEDMAQFSRMVRTFRCSDPVSMLKSLLQEIPWSEYASLVGRSFTVTLPVDSTQVEVVLSA